MPAVALVGDLSTGHGGFPPTAMTSSPISKTEIAGKKPGVVDASCKFATHKLGRATHLDEIRYPTSGSSKTTIEGYALARIGDPLNDGDTIGQGSSNFFLE